MDINRIVDAVFEEVMKKAANTEETKEYACVISDKQDPMIEQEVQADYEVQYYSENLHFKNCKHVIIPFLSVRMLANLANGLSTTKEEAFILNCLLEGKKVTVLCDGVEYYTYKNSSPLLLYKVYEEYERKLKEFGILFQGTCETVDNNTKRVTEVCDVVKEDDKNTAEKPHLLSKKVISETDLQKLYMQNITEIEVEKKCIITPLAKDFIRTHHLQIVESWNKK